MTLSRLSLAIAGCVLAAAAPHGALAGQTVSEAIALPTFGSPAVPRMLSSVAGANGLAGYVFEIANGTSRFSLRSDGGATDLEDFDIAFYATLDQSEPLASFSTFGNESGAIPAGASWAVVTMSAGADGTFRYDAS